MNSQLYRQQIIDHYKNPRNSEGLDEYDFKSKDANTICGDEIITKVKMKNGKIENLSFETKGCAISVATASLLSDEIKGMTIAEIKKLDADYIQELLGTRLTSSRIKCATLALNSINNILNSTNDRFTT